MGAAIWRHADMLVRGGIAAYRWGGCARPGMWSQSVDFPGGHIHMQCVVDDFGNLVPVDLAAMLPNVGIVEFVQFEGRLQ